MTDYLVKAIDKTKNLRLLTITAKGVVSEAQKLQDTWSASSAVLGRTLVGGLLLAGAQLTDKEELTVRLLGNGPIRILHYHLKRMAILMLKKLWVKVGLKLQKI